MAFVERKLDPFPRGHRPGTRRTRATARGIRRRGPRGRAAAGGGAASLDSCNHLATSVHEWLQLTETKDDRLRQKKYYQQRLIRSLRYLWRTELNPEREKDHSRIAQCQQEWIGFRAACCGGRAMAVPIGCNHRLCPVCAAHRAERYRDRVRCLFDRLQHPWFVTLTTPGIPAGKLRKRSFSDFRRKVRTFIKRFEPWMQGGCYALETTFNAARQEWHLHTHILVDAAFPVPARRAGFIEWKMQMEFSWLQITGGRDWKAEDYGWWRKSCVAHPAGDPWNKINRRVIDLRPVRDRNKAAMEVFKYITKVADFVDDPFAVDEFLTAAKGVRLLQTFGSWYGFKFDEPEPVTAELKCACGLNRWERIGTFHGECIEILPDGRAAVRESVLKKQPGG